MSRSNWGDWAKPDRADTAGAGTGVQVEREGQFGDDLSQVEPLRALIAAEGRRPVLMPLFPVGFFTPQSPCPHNGPIPPGSTLCCMVCHQSGMDHHPALRENADGLVKLKNFKPPKGGDQWGNEGDVAAEPTRYEGDAKADVGRRQLKQFARKPG